MTRPSILLVNDDGINSGGLWAAYDALSSFAEVTVVSPAVQQSGVGRSISIFEPLRMNKVSVGGCEAYVVSGRPTDCAILGIRALHKEFDLVVSGVNLGENITFESITTSGTVGAAMEAANQGVPSIAFSMEMNTDGEKFTDPREHVIDFGAVREVVSKITRFFLEHPFPKNTHLINVNIPARSINGYRVTHLGARFFDTTVEERIDPRGKPYYWICGAENPVCDAESDVVALREGFVSVTPLTMDNCEHESLAELAGLVAQIR
ncbi:MAG TPA: 5'/3'-nucleotidase SurE [Methanocorpusculum sp.]|nr:5'/3'-nucleotidase SurE [Methanocorpusculum sp.]